MKCLVACCDREAGGSKGYCYGHYRRLQLGKPLDTPLIQVAPKGSGYTDSEGYRRIGKQKVHRMIMEQMLGRKLLPHENVHHKNGDRQDNSPANLELWINHQPRGARVEDHIEYALRILKTYSPDLLKGN